MVLVVDYAVGALLSLRFWVLVLLTYYVYKRLIGKKYNLAPKPMSYPIIGNNYHVFFSGEALYRLCKSWAEKVGPVMRVSLGPFEVVILNDYDSVHEAMVQSGNDFSGRMESYTFDIFTDGKKDILFATPEQPTFNIRRKLMASALKNFTVGRPYENRVSESLGQLFVHFDTLAESSKSFNPTEYCKLVSYNVTASMCFQKGYAFDDAEFKDISDMFQAINDAFASGITLSDFIPFVQYLPFQLWDVKMVTNFRNKMMSIIEREVNLSRQRGKETDEVNDLTLFLLKTKKENKNDGLDKVTELEIMHIISDVFSAGVDTTQITLRWILLCLAVHQDVQQKIYDEIQDQVDGINGHLISVIDYKAKMPYSEAVLLETTRYGTVAVMGLAHAAMVDAKVGGYDVPNGTAVIINQWAINHDENNFDRPEEFLPERFLDEDGKVGARPKGYLPFGLGRRACPGETAARNTLWMTMVALVRRYRILPPEGVKLVAEYRNKGFEGTPVDYEILLERREESRM